MALKAIATEAKNNPISVYEQGPATCRYIPVYLARIVYSFKMFETVGMQACKNVF